MCTCTSCILSFITTCICLEKENAQITGTDKKQTIRTLAIFHICFNNFVDSGQNALLMCKKQQ